MRVLISNLPSPSSPSSSSKRPGPDLNRRMTVLQTVALPLGHQAGLYYRIIMMSRIGEIIKICFEG